MSLLDRLSAIAAELPPSHTVSTSSTPGVLAALVLFAEHGEQFLRDVEEAEDGVVGVLTRHAEQHNADAANPPADTPPSQPAPTAPVGPIASDPSPAPVPPVSGSDAPPSPPADDVADQGEPSRADLVAQIQTLQAQLADTRRATAGSVTDDSDPAVTPPAEPASIEPGNGPLSASPTPPPAA